jgi:hypothetical protein
MRRQQQPAAIRSSHVANTCFPPVLCAGWLKTTAKSCFPPVHCHLQAVARSLLKGFKTQGGPTEGGGAEVSCGGREGGGWKGTGSGVDRVRDGVCTPSHDTRPAGGADTSCCLPDQQPGCLLVRHMRCWPSSRSGLPTIIT